MVAALQSFLDAGNEDAASKGFELFDDLISVVRKYFIITIYAQESSLLSKHVGDLIQFFVGVAANAGYPEGLRIQALTFLMWCTV
jgi:hypothetical protein